MPNISGAVGTLQEALPTAPRVIIGRHLLIVHDAFPKEEEKRIVCVHVLRQIQGRLRDVPKRTPTIPWAKSHIVRNVPLRDDELQPGLVDGQV